MCGITGIMAFNLVGKFNRINVTAATMSLSKRGPDHQDIYIDNMVGLGHRRLSIIDTSSVAHQPMWDETKRFCIVFNGEIFNYQILRQDLLSKGVSFQSQSDTEVLLQLFITYKEKCLEKVNGFFAFCIYDKLEQSFFLARDRYGVKPLLYLFDEDKFIFASEMKTMLHYGIDKSLDYNSLYTYLQLNYIPAPDTIFPAVKKLMPGHYIIIKVKQIKISKWYEIPYDPASVKNTRMTYDDAMIKTRSLLEEAVKRRLVADVPLGAFLSGGIDSSVITGLAARHKPDLHTFSIGFRDEKFFDETHYARLVAKHFKTEHTVFSLSNTDLYDNMQAVLNYTDEPFADSSAINVYILSKETRKHATVALSGDGADEILAGYNKHAAFYAICNKGWKENVVQALLPIFQVLPKSRNSKYANVIRQLTRFAEGAQLSPQDRYWRWAGFASESSASRLLSVDSRQRLVEEKYTETRNELLRFISTDHSINDVLRTDMDLVLQNDMLTKVDLMSMANGLEVRTPFLDYEFVNFMFSLPGDFKIDKHLRKKILQDSFRDFLPAELYNRPKKGFEVPMLKWLRKEMRSTIEDDLLAEDFIRAQGIFDYDEVDAIKKKLFSSNPEDVHARVWGLIVFQHWWKQNISILSN